MSNDYVQECGLIDLSELQITGKLKWVVFFQNRQYIKAGDEWFDVGGEEGIWFESAKPNIVQYDCEIQEPPPVLQGANDYICDGQFYYENIYGRDLFCIDDLVPDVGHTPSIVYQQFRGITC